MANLQNATLNYTAGGAKCQSYYAWDASSKKKRPGVLVIHEWWGLNDYVKGRADQLAEMGYAALAVDMYGNGLEAASADAAGKAMQKVLGDMKNGGARLATSLSVLKAQDEVDAKKTGAIGYCFGGAMVLHMARAGMDVDAVVSFHGALGSFHKPEPGSVKASVLVCHGEKDKLIPAADVENFKKEMTSAKANFDFVSYPGALHGFTNPGATAKGKENGLPLAYDEKTDKASWDKMKSHFDKTFR